MPLPFLSADSGRAAALPHPVKDTWTRPYHLGPLRVATAALMLVLSSYLLVAAVIIGVASGAGAAERWLAAAVVVIVCALRILRVGVWISGRGLRQVRLFSTVTVPWDRVGTVRTAQQPVRWLGLPRTVQGQALLVTRSDGTPLRPLLSDRSGDFLWRAEAFDVAADALEAKAAELR